MSYEALARFYDAVMGDRSQEAVYIRSLIRKHHRAPKTVLELACGTGAVLEQLQADFDVTGVDRSQAMLERAAAKLPSARLVHADMTDFALAERFDVVLCVFDSINHVLELEQWEAVFERAREHLDTRGVFIFDMNTQAKLERFGRSPALPQWFGDGHLVLVDVRPTARGVSIWDLRIFERLEDSTYRLHREEIPEVAFPAERVRESLSARFSTVRMYDRRLGRPSARSEVLYFACKA